MTEWTSISVKKAQKDELTNAKDDANHNGSMGEFLLMIKDAYESDHYQTKADGSVDTDDIAEAISTVEPELDAEALAEELSKKLGSDLEQASYRGAKDALESML